MLFKHIGWQIYYFDPQKTSYYLFIIDE